MTAVPPATCSQAGCTLPQGGKCLENLTATTCPHYGKAPTPVQTTVAPAAIGVAGHSFGLSAAEAGDLLAMKPANVILLAGDSNSGKTTLFAAIYERLLDGPFGEFVFAGSKTLHGFESRSYQNRGGYGHSEPDTPHTPTSNPNPILHLRVAPKARLAHPIDIMLIDVSGELFKLARNNAAVLSEVPGLRRADHVGVLLDGELLSSLEKRQGCILSTKQIIEACLSAGFIGKSTSLDLIVTKYDLIRPNAQAEEFVDEKLANFESMFTPRLAQVRSYKTAARDPKMDLERGYGLVPLLAAWVEPFVAAPGRTPRDGKAVLREVAYGGTPQ